MEKQKTEYDLSNFDLLDAFAKSVDQRFKSRGFRFDGLKFEDNYLYFCGILLSRLEGVKPPVSAGNIVHNKIAYRNGGVVTRRTVKRVYYVNDGNWQVTFTDDNPSHFPPELEPRHCVDEFEIVPAMNTTST